MKKVNALTGVLAAGLASHALNASADPKSKLADSKVKKDSKESQTVDSSDEEDLNYFKLLMQSMNRIVNPSVSNEGNTNCTDCASL